MQSITMERVYRDLREGDMAQGKWVDEDPSLIELRQMIRAREEAEPL